MIKFKVMINLNTKIKDTKKPIVFGIMQKAISFTISKSKNKLRQLKWQAYNKADSLIDSRIAVN